MKNEQIKQIDGQIVDIHGRCSALRIQYGSMVFWHHWIQDTKSWVEVGQIMSSAYEDAYQEAVK